MTISLKFKATIQDKNMSSTTHTFKGFSLSDETENLTSTVSIKMFEAISPLLNSLITDSSFTTSLDLRFEAPLQSLAHLN